MRGVREGDLRLCGPACACLQAHVRTQLDDDKRLLWDSCSHQDKTTQGAVSPALQF